MATSLPFRTNPEARLPAYFYRLSSRAQRTYLKSEAVERFDYIPTAAALNSLATLMRVLETDNLAAVTTCARALTAEICGELHGLFYPYDPRTRRQPYIVLWMQTAQRHDVVKPKTFVRTLMHEIGHYLDYALLRLEDSYHTGGFFKRESSLVRALFNCVALT